MVKGYNCKLWCLHLFNWMWALTFLHLAPTDQNSLLAPLKMRVQPVALWSFHLRKSVWMLLLRYWGNLKNATLYWVRQGAGLVKGVAPVSPELCLGHEIAASSPQISWRERRSLLGVPRRVRGCRAGHEAHRSTCPCAAVAWGCASPLEPGSLLVVLEQVHSHPLCFQSKEIPNQTSLGVTVRFALEAFHREGGS